MVQEVNQEEHYVVWLVEEVLKHSEMERVSRLGNLLWQHQKPLQCLQEAGTENALILLNRPLKKQLSLLKHLWKTSIIKICADGALNQLNEALGVDSDMYIPDIISGDFDSVDENLLTHYKSKGSLITPTPDQDETDFTKGICIMIKQLEERSKLEDYSCIICLGAFGGRIDHIMSNINTLYTAARLQKKPCYLMSSSEVACLLQPGSHVIHVDTGFEGDWCGLIPVGSAAEKVYTTGLKWNLDGQKLAFGSLISTSNEIQNKEITIETTDPVLSTFGIKYL